MILVLGVRLVIKDSPQIVTLASFLLYLASTGGILIWETRQKDFKRYLTTYASLVFILCGILPVLALRIMEWNEPFDFVGMLSMSGTQWEKNGNYLFMAVIVAHFIDSTRQRIHSLNDSQQQNP